jgi:hypothetical protein
MKKIIAALLFISIHSICVAQTTIVKYLSGTDKDHTVNWDFFCTDGRNSGRWTTIPVPSNWELQGFGTYNYGHDKVKSSEHGLYKHEFASGKWTGKKIFIVFEGSMTDTKVMINGQQVGPVHQGAFYRFKYDVTSLVKANGKNLLEVDVAKTSSNFSVNQAERKSDFWLFGGIYRPVYLEVVPERFIDRVAVNAKADGSFDLNVFPRNLKGNETIEAQIQTLAGKAVGLPFTVKAGSSTEGDSLILKSKVSNALTWTAEFPNLYQVQVSIKNAQQVVHRMTQKFGFRTIELRTTDGLYINGEKVLLKGSNRHSFWPESGRTLSHAVHLMDAKLMKEMNMNAVRMSHYPPDQDFLAVCDSIGLYVIDELTGWQAKYDTVVGRKLVKELVIRDVNHPSVIFWANGNEGGFNRGLDNDYAWYDPQNRTVIHPYEKFNGTDTHHYQDYNSLLKTVATGKEVFFPTEFMHGLYDGGAGAGLDDFWNQILLHPYGAGGFIWAFVDEAVVRTDKNGEMDTDGNHGADGIVGPHREKEGSFFAIKEIWSPIYVGLKEIDASFKGTIEVENRYDFTNLSQCTFHWKLVNFPSANQKSIASTVTVSGSALAPDMKPGQKGSVKLQLPVSWAKSEALYLTAIGPDKKEVFTWSWAIKPEVIKPDVNLATAASKVSAQEEGNVLRVTCDGVTYLFDQSTGYIQQVLKSGGAVSLSNGPVLAGARSSFKSFSHRLEGGQYIVNADYEGEGSLQVKWTFKPGQMAKLEYQYALKEASEFSGITFNYPEDKITAMKWKGRGPFRVWKNRMKGQQLGVWHKNYDNAITGETWQYPEFKGYHAEVSWVVIENKESPFTVYTADKNMFFQMLRPGKEKNALNDYASPQFPDGSLGFLSAINAIGNKFHPAKSMGPESQKNQNQGEIISRTLWFDFSH